MAVYRFCQNNCSYTFLFLARCCSALRISRYPQCLSLIHIQMCIRDRYHNVYFNTQYYFKTHTHAVAKCISRRHVSRHSQVVRQQHCETDSYAITKKKNVNKIKWKTKLTCDLLFIRRYSDIASVRFETIIQNQCYYQLQAVLLKTDYPL